MIRGVLLLAMISTSALAEPRQWMLHDDPGSLAYSTFLAENCRTAQFRQVDLDEIVRKVFESAEITPVPVSSAVEIGLFLRVDLHCLGRDRGVALLEGGRDTRIYLLDVKFATGKFAESIMDYPDQYGSFGRDDYTAVDNVAEASVEAAVADYVEAQVLYGSLKAR